MKRSKAMLVTVSWIVTLLLVMGIILNLIFFKLSFINFLLVAIASSIILIVIRGLLVMAVQERKVVSGAVNQEHSKNKRDERRAKADSSTMEEISLNVLKLKKSLSVLKSIGFEDVNFKYNALQELNVTIRASAMSEVQKKRAEELSGLADKTIDNAKELSKLGVVAVLDIEKIEAKLDELTYALEAMLEKERRLISSRFDNITIPESYAKQDRLEQLREQGKALLLKIENNTEVDNIENKVILNKVVYERLDELWQNYEAAKNDISTSNNDVLRLGSKVKDSPDIVLDDIFNSISTLYSDINSGFTGINNSKGMSDLLSSKNYFERRLGLESENRHREQMNQQIH